MKKVLLATVFLAIATPAYAEGRPKGCPSLWCGCWLAKHLGIADASLNRAREWLKFPHTTARPGAVAVLRRGKRGGHVGIVKAVDANGNPVIKSGNHGGRVGTGVYPKSRVIAYVAP